MIEKDESGSDKTTAPFVYPRYTPCYGSSNLVRCADCGRWVDGYNLTDFDYGFLLPTYRVCRCCADARKSGKPNKRHLFEILMGR